MTFTRRVALGASVAFLATVPGAAAHAQGATTGAITGLVTDANGRPLENAQVQVVNRATGFSTGQQTRANGRYYVQNLEVGPNYAVTVRLIGYAPVTREPIRVALTQATRADVQLQQAATQLTAVTVTAAAARSDVFSPTKQGVSTTVSDTLIRRIPNLDRDFTALARLTPQVTSQSGGFSAAGANPRLGQFTIDGANQSDRFGLNSTGGQPGGATGGRLIPIDAVKEVQVALTPTDIRQGNFAGVLVNAVTRSGTNTFTGGASYTYRNPSLARDTSFVTLGNLRQQQFGGFLGGPIIRDRLHFFAALERQERTNPASGPYFPGGAAPTDTVAGGGGIRQYQVDSVRSIANSKYGVDAGTADLVSLGTPLTNFVGRLDFQANSQNRFVLRQLVNSAETVDFSRNTTTYTATPTTQGSGIRLTSNQIPRINRNYSTVFQAFTNLPAGISNEFTGAYNRIRDVRQPPGQTPEVSIASPGLGGANSQITFGTERNSGVNVLRQQVLELTNNLTVPVNAHTLTFGGRFEYDRIFNDFEANKYGAYKFASIAAFAAGTPASYAVAYPNGNAVAADFRTQVFSAYAQDQWAANQRLTVTGGLRVDVPRLPDRPAYNASITTGFAARGIYGVATSNKPKTRALVAPRLGVNWDVNGDQTFQLRANAGMYTGQPPYILIGNSYQNTGLGLATLTCTAAGTVPQFVPDGNNQPKACLGGTAPLAGTSGTAGVSLTDPNFKYPQRFVSSAGFDRRLPGGFSFSLEGLYGKDVNGLRIRDLNLVGPRQVGGQDYTTIYGRVLYADTITSGGANSNTFAATNNGQKAIVSNGPNNVGFTSGAILLTNQSKAYNYSVTPTLRKRFGANVDLNASYTYTRSFEVQAFTSDVALSNWRFGREYSGRENSDDLTTSSYELRHRVQFFGTLSSPWRRFPTDLSFEYQGNTGQPVTYVASGDLNGDGFDQNDPIYIPRNATDPNEVRIVRLQNSATGATFNATTNPYTLNADAARSFEGFIAGQKCLRDQRGQIMKRNSCFLPWQNLLNASLRQTLPEYRGNRLTAQLDVFNVLNLLNNDWGVNRRAILSTNTQQQVLVVRNRLPGPLGNEALTSYEFAPSLVGSSAGSYQAYQDRVNEINNVYRLQLTFRYTF